MTEKCGAQYRGTLVSTLHFCEQPTGHTGAHLCRELMWWADDCTPKAEAPPETGHTAEIEIRRTLWLGHGHNGPALYGDDGEMQCKACHKEWDYRRADLSVLAHQALAALKAEVQRLTESQAEAWSRVAQACAERDDRIRLCMELKAERDTLDCTRREGGDTRHCRHDRPCLRCRLEQAERNAWAEAVAVVEQMQKYRPDADDMRLDRNGAWIILVDVLAALRAKGAVCKTDHSRKTRGEQQHGKS